MMVIDEATVQSRMQARAVAALQAIKPPQTT
jgi:hypothetical protein